MNGKKETGIDMLWKQTMKAWQIEGEHIWAAFNLPSVCVCMCVCCKLSWAGRAESIIDQQGFSHKLELGLSPSLWENRSSSTLICACVRVCLLSCYQYTSAYANV